MSLLVDAIYLVAALLSAPVVLGLRAWRGKAKIDWHARLGGGVALPAPARPRLLLHAVSVGEVNAIRGLVAQLESEFEIVIATTTDTGQARARSLFGSTHHVVRYPLDLSWAVRRFLDATRPDAVALVELEVWPNFTRACQQRGVPVAVINGRLSDRSFPRYRRIAAFIRPSFRRLSLVIAQDETIAERFVAVGVRPERVRVVATMKWDNALENQDGLPAAAQRLAVLLGLDRARPIVVAGSTGPGEEALIHAAVPPDVQLLIAPRKPERFDEAARAIEPCVRRSTLKEAPTLPGGAVAQPRHSREGGNPARAGCTTTSPDAHPYLRSGPALRGRDVHGPRWATDPGASGANRFLLDSIGELRAAYALADLIIVGRTFSNQRGSDMMEPIALGKAVIVGPDVRNFDSVARALLDGAGMIQTTAGQLPHVISRLLDDPAERATLARRGLSIIRANQGSVAQQARLLADLIKSR